MTEPTVPRPASTILLLRDGPSGLETFMVVRHHEIDFASGALVFPGGRMEAADVGLAAERARADPLAPFKVAAIREAFEECGLLLARAEGEDAIVPAARAAGLDRAAPFCDLMARERLVPALDALVPFAHWITPDFVPKRFDTHFFLALAPEDQILAHDGREAVDFALDLGARGAGRAREAVQAPVPHPSDPLEALGPRKRRLGSRRRPRGARRDRPARKDHDRRRAGAENPDRGGLRRRGLFCGWAAVAACGRGWREAPVQRNLAFSLTGRLMGKPCQFAGSDLKIQVADEPYSLSRRHGRVCGGRAPGDGRANPSWSSRS